MLVLLMDETSMSKKNKTVRVDDIPAKFLQALGEEGTEELVEMCKEMYVSK